MRGYAPCAGVPRVVGSSAMGIKVALEHRTSYTFDRLVEVFPHVVRLRPAPHSRTPIEAYSLQVEPADHFVNWQQDAFGNFLARLVFPTRARSLTITVGLIADMKVINPFDFFIEEYAETFPFEYPKDLARGPQALPAAGRRGRRGLRTRRARPGVGQELRHRPRHAHHRLPGRRSTARSTPTSATACAWNRACRRRTSPCAPASAPAATRRGCWCRCCARWAWPPASCRATWCS